MNNKTTQLSDEKCVPCRTGAPAATPQEREEWLRALPGWRIKNNGIPELERSYEFKDFKEALDFTVKISEEAEKQDHHPAIDLEWGKATVRWSTHKIKNLHRNDFVMAAKTEAIYNDLAVK